MKYKIKVQVPVENRSLLGFKKTVLETRTMDGKTYKRMQKEWKNRQYSIEEMMLYDDLF